MLLLKGIERHAGRIKQEGFVRVPGFPAAALLRPHLLGPTKHDVALFSDLENELDLGHQSGIRVVGAQRCRILIVLRRLTEQRKGHGAENGGFARTGLAVNAEEASLHRIAEIENDPLRIGPEGLHGQAKRPHASSSA